MHTTHSARMAARASVHALGVSASETICTNPVWSRTSANTMPPMSRCLFTHPHRVTVFPTSESRRVPHVWSRAGHVSSLESHCDDAAAIPSLDEAGDPASAVASVASALGVTRPVRKRGREGYPEFGAPGAAAAIADVGGVPRVRRLAEAVAATAAGRQHWTPRWPRIVAEEEGLPRAPMEEAARDDDIMAT